MALARILKSLDGVPADVAKEYKEVDGQFVLDITGDDLTPLVNAKKYEKEAHDATKVKLAKAEEDILQMRRGAVSKEDLDAIENSYKDKLTALETANKDALSVSDKRLKLATVKAAALKIASELSDSPALMLPYISKRLSVEFGEDDEAIIRVRGADGKASALTIDDLKKDLVANSDLTPIIRGSKGTGGQQPNGTQQQQQQQNGGGAVKLAEMTEAQRIAMHRADPEGFKKLVAEAQQ